MWEQSIRKNRQPHSVIKEKIYHLIARIKRIFNSYNSLNSMKEIETGIITTGNILTIAVLWAQSIRKTDNLILSSKKRFII
jgi:hypothetical protein